MSSNIRRFLFDTLLFTYTAAIVVYSASPSIDQEFFIVHMKAVFAALIITTLIAAAFTAILRLNRVSTVGSTVFEGAPAGSLWRSFWFLHLLLISALTFWVSLRVTDSSLRELLDRDGLQGAGRLWSGMMHPNFALLPKVIAETIETVFIAFLATALAIPVAFVLAFFTAKNLMTRPAAFAVYAALRLIMNVSRSVEPLVWALIFTVWVGVGPFAGMLALMVHSVASLTKYYSEILEGVNEGPLDGVRATGAHPIQVIWYAVLPQVLLPYIAMTLYRWDTNVRMATVIGLVGGGGVGTLLIQYQGQAMWPEVGCIILVIAVIVWLMDTASAYIREALK